MPKIDNTPSDAIVLEDEEPRGKGASGRLYYLGAGVMIFVVSIILGGMWIRLHHDKADNAAETRATVAAQAAPSIPMPPADEDAGSSSSYPPPPTTSGDNETSSSDKGPTHPELAHSDDGSTTSTSTQDANEQQQERQEEQAAYQQEVEQRGAPTSYQSYLASQRGSQGVSSTPSYSPALPQMPVAPAESPELSALAQRLAGHSPAGGGNDPNGQQNKSEFISDKGQLNPADDYLKATRVSPISTYEIQQDAWFPAIIPVEVNSDTPGMVTALIRQDVNDSLCDVTRKDGSKHCYVLIPAGSRLVGEYNSNVSPGQDRIQVVWNRIIFPDTTSMDLDRWNSHSANGSAGLKDQVDNHWKNKIMGVVLTSVLSAGLQISQNHGGNGSVLSYPSTGQIAASSIGQSVSQLGQEITRQNFQQQPTIKIRPGQKFVVKVKKDIVFPGPYEPRY